jgi:protein phosphatase
MTRVEFFELSRAGAGRSRNGDTVRHWAVGGGVVFALAAGLGEGDAAPEASAFALETLAGELTAAPSDWPVLKLLRRAVQAANVALYHKRVTVPELQSLGTTVTVTAVVGRTLTAAHVGNCRLWLLRGHTLTQLTKDHTWGREQSQGGVLATPDPHARRYALPRCLGHELTVSVDLLTMELQAADVLLHTSDGVHGALAEREIQELLEAHPPDAACRALVRRAHESDDRDDASAQAAAVSRLPVPASRPWWRFGL